LTPDALSGSQPVDLALVNLGTSPTAGIESIQTFVREAQPLPVPVLAIVGETDPDPSWRDDLTAISINGGLTPERLVQAVAHAVETRQGRALWHGETGLPSPLGLRTHLRGMIQRARRERQGITLVCVKTALPRAPVTTPWPRLLRPKIRREDYVGVAGDDALALAVYGAADSARDRIGQRFSQLVEATLGISVTDSRQLIYPDDGSTTEDLLASVTRWTSHTGWTE